MESTAPSPVAAAPSRAAASPTVTRWRVVVAACALLVLTAGLRFYHIDAQSLWYDEGVSAGMALLGPRAIVAGAAADFHPPLYYLLLAGWAHLFGDGVVALRGLTACFGTLLVVATWRLATRLFDEPTGWLAALWAAVAPLGVTYSQELRMYMPVAACVALAAWGATAWLDAGSAEKARGPSARIWPLAAYVLLAAIALYLQYVAIFGLTAIGLYGLLRARGGQLWRWLLANVAVLLLFASWLPVLVHQVTVGQKAAEAAASNVLPSALESLLVGTNGLLFGGTTALVLLAALVVVGVPVTLHRGAPRALRGSLPLLLLLGPLLGATAYAALRVVYEVHFILAALPAVAIVGAAGGIAVARGLVALLHRQTVAPVAFGLLGCAVTLASLSADARYFVAPLHPNDDYRGLAQTIARTSAPGDAVLLYAPGQGQVFSYYYRGPDTVIGLPLQRPPDRADVTARLEALAAQHHRIWVVEYGQSEADPSGMVSSWLAQHAFIASHQWFGSVQLLLYGVSGSQDGVTVPVDARFANGAELVGYAVQPAAIQPGGTLGLTLVWQDLTPISQRYTVFAHLLDANNKVVAQHDGEPAGATKPTTSWQPGQQVDDLHGMVVPTTLPPGRYTIEVGMYLPQGGQRSAIMPEAGQAPADHLILGQVVVQQP